MFGIGHQELIIIFGIVFLIFGAKRLPEMGKGLAKPFGFLKRAWKRGHKLGIPRKIAKTKA